MDATLLLDDPLSSPDPLAEDELPSSPQSRTRRIAMPHHDYSMAAADRSSSPAKSPTRSSARPRSVSRSVSPRKRTFELDVGNQSSPQRILVTVEADDALRPGTNRRLFPPASPTRSSPSRSPTRTIRRSEETTTRKVPLRGLSDDEGFGDNSPAPKKRGRPRKSGTPVPKSRKRAGTPLKPTDSATRPRLEPPSDASIFGYLDMGEEDDVRDATPKPQPKSQARKTPKRASTPGAIPSSQVPASKQTTGKKRGRPRKALMPEEVAEIAIAGSELDTPKAQNPILNAEATEDALSGHNVRSSIETLQEDLPREDPDVLGSDVPYPNSPDREESVDPIPPELTILEPLESLEPVLAETAVDHRQASETRYEAGEVEAYSDDIGEPIDDGYAPLMEPEDDGGSDDGTVDSANPVRQDTLTHASDFSMIAVESLPSFQASFQGNLSRIPEDANERSQLGEATNMMINQTLETLRRSMLNENTMQNFDGEDDEQPQSEPRPTPGFSSAARRPRKSPMVGFSSSPLGSPRRLGRKSQPLSRQVLTGHIRRDDSFSSIPEEILAAATPGRLQQASTVAPQQEGQADTFEDSFSEIPEAILEAATPRPPRRGSRELHSGLQSSPVNHGASPDRTTGSARQSNRLPTPDDTSSSNTRRSSQEEQEQEQEQGGEVSAKLSNDFAQSRSQAQVPSSPPNIVVQPFDSPERRPGSRRRDPQREIPESPQFTASFSENNKEGTLEAPTSARRPTLSPIVRVARTLQSVMSDKSSPEGLESNLGSPFRGSHSRQSSITKSPVRASADLFGRSTNSQAPGRMSSSSRNGQLNFHQRNGSASLLDPQSAIDPFGPQISLEQQQRDNSRLYNREKTRSTPERIDPNRSVQVSSSTKGLLPSDDRMSWAADESPLRARSVSRQSITEALRRSSDSMTRKSRTPPGSLLQRPPQRNIAPSPVVQDAAEQDGGDEDDVLLDAADDDLWEFEASRPELQASSQIAPDQSNDNFRRSKIPSPWRSSLFNGKSSQFQPRSSQFQDNPPNDFSSPSHILLDESPQKPPALFSVSRPEVAEFEDEPEEHFGQQNDDAQEDLAEPQDELPEQLEQQQGEDERHLSEALNSPQNEVKEHSDRPLGSDYSLLQERGDKDKLPSEKSVESVNVEEYSMIAPQVRQNKRANGVQPVNVQEEYSLIAPEPQQPRPEPAPAKSGILGNILSFFSSPATLPKTGEQPVATGDKTPSGKANNSKKPEPRQNIAQPNVAKLVPKPAQPSLWSTGLFPSVAQKEFHPSPERGSSLFSPAKPATSEPAAPESSPLPPQKEQAREKTQQQPLQRPQERPSTPEHQTSPAPQAFPSIDQKRNFTPRSGQNGSSLFSKSQGNTPAQNRPRIAGTVGFLDPSNNRDPDTSMATEDSEYERVPPREIPSRWDKTLSPSKSSFRSPMKPTTPGRVVAFKSNVIFPSADPNEQLPSDDEEEETTPTQSNDLRRSVAFKQPPPLLQPRNQAPENELRFKSAANTAAARVRHSSSAQSDCLDKAYLELGQAFSSTTTTKPNALLSNSFPQPKAFALTSTTWTKAHWVRFDEILQLRRRDPARFRRDHPYASPSANIHNNGRQGTSSGGKKTIREILLGKEVTSQGEKMVLEGWHVEVVQAFLQELEYGPGYGPGQYQEEDGFGFGEGNCPWDEKYLAKRLFALIIGEARRRAWRKNSGPVHGNRGGSGDVLSGAEARRREREREREREWEQRERDRAAMRVTRVELGRAPRS